MTESRLIGIFGGTFDPIHNGHLQSVVSLLDELSFNRIHLLPSATPPHRSPTQSSAEHRLRMVELAIEPYSLLFADDRECNREGKSYTIDTLKSFRAEFPNDSLVFIVGMDAYLNMQGWKQWQDFLEYAHIVVMQRPGYEIEPSWGDEFVTHATDSINNSLNGSIYFAQTKRLDISSTKIREKLYSEQCVKAQLPEAIINYISQHKLYANT